MGTYPFAYQRISPLLPPISPATFRRPAHSPWRSTSSTSAFQTCSRPMFVATQDLTTATAGNSYAPWGLRRIALFLALATRTPSLVLLTPLIWRGAYSSLKASSLILSLLKNISVLFPIWNFSPLSFVYISPQLSY